MNLSKILVSVNIAATLPIAVQIGAQASNQTPTETNSLKDSVNSLTTQTKRASHVSVDNKNFNLVKASSSTVEVNGVKLRAFMPGRRLPSSSDLQANLVSQQAQMAPIQQSSLNGQVTESSRASAYAYPDMTSQYASSAPRVVLNQVQAVARQVRANSKKRTQAPTPTSIAPAQTASNDFGKFSNDIPASWMANEKNLSVIEAPSPSPREMAQIDRLNDQSNPAQATGTAGPPPFPLNLLPQQSLKQFMGAGASAGAGAGSGQMGAAVGGRQQVRFAGPPAGFGSWHQNNATRIASNLAPGGFHTNLHGGHFGSYIAPHAGHKIGSIRQSNNVIAQAHHNQTPGAKVAAYAPYTTSITY